MRKTMCLLLALGLASSPMLAQQPLKDSAEKAATAAADAADKAAQGQTGSGHRARFLSGAILGVAGGAAIILGTTAIKRADTTSGNTPKGAYQSCVALKANPVYKDNQCDDLRGFNNAVVFGGLAAAVAGITLMMTGSSMSSVEFGPGGVRLQHRVKF